MDEKLMGASDSHERRAPIRLVVGDDSHLIREVLIETLSRAAELDLVAVCSNVVELRHAVAACDPDVVLTDIRMPPTRTDEGIQMAAELRETKPNVGVVVLSQYAEPGYALGLLEDGTAGRAYLLKDRVRNRSELIDAVQTVARGGSVIDPMIVEVLIKAQAQVTSSRVAQLTLREREVLAAIAEGKSNAAIADALVLTKRAVEKHVNAIFAKLDLPESEDVSRRVKAALIYLSESDAPGA